jgi:hypothetical protein
MLGEIKMKKYTIIILGIMFFTVGTLVNPIVAAERQKVYEMGESGQTVSFRMTIKEIAAEDTEKERIATIRETKTQKSKQRRKIFEMGESGQIISFPMTADEIVAEDAKIARLKALHDSKVSKEGSEVVTFELAESGETIEFHVKGVDIMTGGVAKTGTSVEAVEVIITQ